MLYPLDRIDQSIINCLHENSQLTNRDIARIIGRSPSSVFDRIKRLRENNIISRYTILIAHEKICNCFISYLHIKLVEHNHMALQAFEHQICSFQEVVNCANVTGYYDYILKICVSDISAYHYFVQVKIGQVSNISDLRTDTVLSELKMCVGYPILNLSVFVEKSKSHPLK